VSHFEEGTTTIIRIGAVLCEQFLKRPQHERQRRSKFVRDVGEERGLGAIQLRQRFGALALFFVGLSVGDRGRDMTGYELEETVVGIVITAKRIQTGDEETGPSGGSGWRDGYRHGLDRRAIPWTGWQQAQG
jgi:hypothetical protein